jgi:hypothetical protein
LYSGRKYKTQVVLEQEPVYIFMQVPLLYPAYGYLLMVPLVMPPLRALRVTSFEQRKALCICAPGKDPGICDHASSLAEECARHLRAEKSTQHLRGQRIPHREENPASTKT